MTGKMLLLNTMSSYCQSLRHGLVSAMPKNGAVASMTAFYRFPHTPHLAWLGSGPVRDDKILTPQEARAFLTYPVTIEEKNDGATIGFSLSPEASLRIQQR